MIVVKEQPMAAPCEYTCNESVIMVTSKSFIDTKISYMY